jgi:hypothetical protein
MEFDNALGDSAAAENINTVGDLELELERLALPVDDKAGGSDFSGNQEVLRELLDPLTHETLKEIVLALAASDPAIAEQVSALASDDVANRKIFVRGLAWGTTSEGLKDAFAAYGSITEGGVAIDKASGKSRGFGFITFETAAGAQAALREPNKNIDGRQTTCNLASVGMQNRTPSGGGRGKGASGAMAMGAMGGAMGACVPVFGSGRGGGMYGGGGLAMSPRMLQMAGIGNMNMMPPNSYERYLSSMYANYPVANYPVMPMVPPPNYYEQSGMPGR